MKSLSDHYQASRSSTHETFADLVFCALIVLVLFVLALTVEISERIRPPRVVTTVVEPVKAEEVALLTNEEIRQKLEELKRAKAEVKALEEQSFALQKEVRQLNALLEKADFDEGFGNFQNVTGRAWIRSTESARLTFATSMSSWTNRASISGYELKRLLDIHARKDPDGSVIFYGILELVLAMDR